MNKFKFGDHVHVAFPHWHDADEIGVVLGSSRGVNNVQFENGGYTGYVPDEYLTLATSWVKCSERMPESGVAVLTYNSWSKKMECEFLRYSDDKRIAWWSTTQESGDVTHWMPLPAPPQD